MEGSWPNGETKKCQTVTVLKSGRMAGTGGESVGALKVGGFQAARRETRKVGRQRDGVRKEAKDKKKR